jgi:hypothetical protein
MNLALALVEFQQREHRTLLMRLQDVQLPPPGLAKEVKITSCYVVRSATTVCSDRTARWRSLK